MSSRGAKGAGLLLDWLGLHETISKHESLLVSGASGRALATPTLAWPLLQEASGFLLFLGALPEIGLWPSGLCSNSETPAVWPRSNLPTPSLCGMMSGAGAAHGVKWEANNKASTGSSEEAARQAARREVCVPDGAGWREVAVRSCKPLRTCLIRPMHADIKREGFRVNACTQAYWPWFWLGHHCCLKVLLSESLKHSLQWMAVKLISRKVV